VWFKSKTQDNNKTTERLLTLEAAVSNLRRRLKETKRELEGVKVDYRKFERELLLKLGRLEGVLGLGLGGGVEDSSSTTRPGLEFEKRRQEEEAERLALEQLGTGGSAQVALDPIVNHEEGEE
jgi:hypothetical protein